MSGPDEADPLAPLIRSLHADGRPRVWSLVITVFGDVVQVRGGRIATGRLRRLLGRVGIETGALRTALSRLASDGWVESHRDGRLSSYALTASGEAEFGPATARIYAPPRLGPVKSWRFGSGPAEGRLAIAGGWLAPADQAAPTEGFGIEGALTEGAAAAVWDALPASHQSALMRLQGDLDALRRPPLPPLDAAVARILLIHRWRRLVLRWPEVPAEVMPEGQSLHDQVAATYARLLPAAEAWFDTASDGLAAMPASAAALSDRFKLQQNP